MEFKKKPKFRIIISDLETKKHKVMTIYKNGKDHNLKEFFEKLKEKIKGI